jgi:hypothetical protein
MRLEEVQSALRGIALPRAPRSLRERVLEEAAKELASPHAPTILRGPRPRVENLSLVGAILASAAVLSIVLFPPAPPPKTRLDELLSRIQDPDAVGRAQAVRSLGDIAGRKAMPLASSLLQDRDRDVRAAAAELLISGGAAELGVPALLREGRGFTVMNLLRTADLWKAMAGARGPELSGRSAPERIREIGRTAGLEVVVPAPSTPEERRWASERRTKNGPPTLLAALEFSLRQDDGSPGPYEVVLDVGAIRLLPRAEALTFWRNWWERK